MVNGVRTFGWVTSAKKTALFPKAPVVRDASISIPPPHQKIALLHIRGPAFADSADSPKWFEIRVAGVFIDDAYADRARAELAKMLPEEGFRCVLVRLDMPIYIGMNPDTECVDTVLAAFDDARAKAENAIGDTIEASATDGKAFGPPYNLDTVRLLNGVGENPDDSKVSVRDIPFAWRPHGYEFFVLAAAHKPVNCGSNFAEQKVLQDDWAVTVYGAFTNSADATAYASDVLQHKRAHHGRAVIVRMYEWIPLDFIACGTSSTLLLWFVRRSSAIVCTATRPCRTARRNCGKITTTRPTWRNSERTSNLPRANSRQAAATQTTQTATALTAEATTRTTVVAVVVVVLVVAVCSGGGGNAKHDEGDNKVDNKVDDSAEHE